VKTKKYSRIPTEEEIAAFNGMHCARLYAQAIANGWTCPSCGRTAYQLIRWTEILGPSWRARYGDEHGMGFTITMTKHHCHAGHRFPQTLICGDCNSADGAAKRKLRLPDSWSFSPCEIVQFVSTTAHSGKTVINYAVAQRIYEEAQNLMAQTSR
jgi:hypothetical protein